MNLLRETLSPTPHEQLSLLLRSLLRLVEYKRLTIFLLCCQPMERQMQYFIALLPCCSVNFLSDSSLGTADSKPKMLSVALEIPVRMPCWLRAPCGTGTRGSPGPSGQGSLHHSSQEQGSKQGTRSSPRPRHQWLPRAWSFHYFLELQSLKYPTKVFICSLLVFFLFPTRLNPHTH